MAERISDARDIWGVSTPQEMFTHALGSLARRGKVAILDGEGLPANHGPLTFYVSDGRWVTTCPDCNGGIPHFPNERRVVCIDCGRGYTARFPADSKDIEKELLKRPIGNRHAMIGETAEMLRDENKARGLG